MLKKWLSVLKVLLMFGVAFAKLTDAGLRLRTTGRAATTNGRIWFLMIGVLGLASASTAWLAAGSPCAAGSSFDAAGPSWAANDCTFWSVCVVCWSVPGRSPTARLMLAS